MEGFSTLVGVTCRKSMFSHQFLKTNWLKKIAVCKSLFWYICDINYRYSFNGRKNCSWIASREKDGEGGNDDSESLHFS